jgi:hypothetical protein
LFFAVQSSFRGKTGATMREHYGSPISEALLVRPGLVVSASRGKSGAFHQPPETHNSDQVCRSNSEINRFKLLSEVTDELVPVSDRGRGTSGDIYDIACLPSKTAGDRAALGKGGPPAHREALWRKRASPLTATQLLGVSVPAAGRICLSRTRRRRWRTCG